MNTTYAILLLWVVLSLVLFFDTDNKPKKQHFRSLKFYDIEYEPILSDN